MDDFSVEEEHRIETRTIHAGQDPNPETGALMTPIHANSTYVQDAPGKDRGTSIRVLETRPARIWRKTLQTSKVAVMEECFPVGWRLSTPS